jgi:ATPase subunit of ABC transporter with duplicated ATPase domains
MSVRDNVRFGLNVRKVPSVEATRRVDEALALVRMDTYADRKPNQLSGGQQARFQILLLELSGATLLLLDEPTDNLDLESAQCLEMALDAFEGTVLAVTHDRWFAKSFDRFLIFGSDASVQSSLDPVWEVKRAAR